MTTGTVEQKVLAILDSFGVELPNGVDTRLDNLNTDSLDDLEILMDLEDEFMVEIDNEVAENWETVADIISFAESLPKG